MENDPRIPVLLLTGFLGAGKTTLLNRILAHLGEENCSLLINEFGATSIDGALVENADDTMVEISDGCICCTVRGEVGDAMLALSKYERKWLILETSGLADPLPLIQTILGHPELTQLYRLQSVITVIDSLNCEVANKEFPEWRSQVSFADCFYLSKTDELDQVEMDNQQQLHRIGKMLSSLNPSASSFDGNQIDALLNFVTTAQLGNDKSNVPLSHDEIHRSHHNHNHHHTERYRSITLTHDKPIEPSQFSMFLNLLGSAYADRVLRMKGFVALVGQSKPSILQAVGAHHDLSPSNNTSPSPIAIGETKIVAIVQNLDPEFIRKMFAGFVGKAEIDTPDQQALSNNPLAISGDWKIGN